MVEQSAAQSYQIPFAFRKTFNPEECTMLINNFKLYDKNKDGTIDGAEFRQMLKELGQDSITEEQVKGLMSRIDKDKNNVIDWMEFLDMYAEIKKDPSKDFGQEFVTKSGQAAATVQGMQGTHTYLMEERSSLARSINKVLKEVDLIKDRLPMDPDSEDLFHVCSDGLVLIFLLKDIQPDLIDLRTVNTGSNLNIFKVRENLNLAFTAMSGLIRTVGVGASDFLDKTPHLVLGVLWQLQKLIQTQSISLKDCPEIMRLSQEGEELEDLLKLGPEAVLIRWVNFHLKNAKTDLRIQNLGKDIADGRAMTYVLNQLDGEKCSLEALTIEDNLKRCEQMVLNSTYIGVADVASGNDIARGNPKVNMNFVAEVFNTKHGLEELTKEEYEAAQLLYDDVEGTNEERSFRFWVNSLDIEGLFVNNLYEECRDGLLLLKVIHRIDPTIIDWSKVSMNPKNIFNINSNCNVAVEACQTMKLTVIGIGAEDIRQGNKKSILALVWQLMRKHYLQIIGSKTEKDLIDWANASVKDMTIANFKDKQLASGHYLIKLAGALEPRIINWELVTPGETEEDKELNAKYAISIARKLGAIIFMVWDDIPHINARMILIFVASLYDLHNQVEN